MPAQPPAPPSASPLSTGSDTTGPPHAFPPQPRIGLALSGGGFRASIFHLGVLRRLEELGLMPRVSVISAVSGGSIIAAYYAIEMEDELRTMPPDAWATPEARLTAHRAVAARFLENVSLNMRSRALVFTPFYHPWLFVKTLALKPFRKSARSLLIQAEYDEHFYHHCTLDQLPAVPPDRAREQRADKCFPVIDGHILTGPQLLLNTTSLMTGERKAFSRDSNTYLAQLKTSNKNVLKLSQVVGASSGVPVLFPPTSICGELLVDGGVSDNQGIEGLLPPIEPAAGKGCPPPPEYSPVNVLLISDASGQLELRHTLSTGAVAVFSRVNDILMYQVRSKLLDRVAAAKQGHEIWFAFVHLLLNLKDDQRVKARVSSEFIEPLARIRTDLDQFSYVEAEALMYHGYTLIDAMVRRWCCELLDPKSIPPLRTPPLFVRRVRDNREARRRIYDELIAGSEKLFLLRCWKKYGWVRVWHRFGWPRVLPIYLLAALAWLGIVTYVFGQPDRFVQPVVDLWHGWLSRIHLPDNAGPIVRMIKDAMETIATGAAGLAGVLTALLLPGYLVSYLLWVFMRRHALRRDRKLYKKLTGVDPESSAWLEWSVEEEEPAPAA